MPWVVRGGELWNNLCTYDVHTSGTNRLSSEAPLQLSLVRCCIIWHIYRSPRLIRSLSRPSGYLRENLREKDLAPLVSGPFYVVYCESQSSRLYVRSVLCHRQAIKIFPETSFLLYTCWLTFTPHTLRSSFTHLNRSCKPSP